jgi:hypothetical protein
MPNTNKFVVKNGLQSQNFDFVSPNGANIITLSISNDDVLSISGNAGQLFSITDSFSGTIFSANDVSGIPSIEVLDTGLVKLAQYSGNVLLGTGTDNATDKLQVNGSITGSVLKSTVAIGTAPLVVNSTTLVTNLNANFLGGQPSTFYTTAANLTGTISSAVLGNSSLFIGTTSVALNRSSANLTLVGVAITPRVSSTASITSPLAWNSNTFDQYAATAQAAALTINADAGTPADGQKIIFRFKDNGTARALTWTTGATNSFRAIGVTLPTTTVISKIVYVEGVYNAADLRWDVIRVNQEA